MNDDLALAVQAFMQKSPPFRIDKFLFNKQLEFVNDTSPFKTAVCSRRAGKTVSCAAHLIEVATQNEGVVCLYITLSRNNAKKLIWPELLRINRVYNLGGSPDNTELSIKFDNNSVIYASGAKDRVEIEKFRGIPLKLCYIDECQSFRDHLASLIDDILAPALLDYAGSLCLIGTPGPIPSGYFHECSVSSATWSKHAWTFFDNPHISAKSGMSHQDLLTRELTRRGVSADDPSIQREFFGKWVLDTESLLLKYNASVNHFDSLPGGKWDYILGIDLGYVDADALAVLAWSESSPVTYLVAEKVVSKQGITELVADIHKLEQQFPISKMVIDEGGLGKKIAEEIRRRHHIPVLPADKIRKMENVALLNDALRTGRFKAKKNSRFAQDSYLVEIDREKTTPDKIRVKDTYHSDIIDACLYAFRESPAFSYQVPIVRAKPGTPEWAKEEVTEMEQNAQAHFEALEQAEKGFGGWNW